jgi:hypothetical protein
MFSNSDQSREAIQMKLLLVPDHQYLRVVQESVVQ